MRETDTDEANPNEITMLLLGGLTYFKCNTSDTYHLIQINRFVHSDNGYFELMAQPTENGAFLYFLMQINHQMIKIVFKNYQRISSEIKTFNIFMNYFLLNTKILFLQQEKTLIIIIIKREKKEERQTLAHTINKISFFMYEYTIKQKKQINNGTLKYRNSIF